MSTEITKPVLLINSYISGIVKDKKFSSTKKTIDTLSSISNCEHTIMARVLEVDTNSIDMREHTSTVCLHFQLGEGPRAKRRGQAGITFILILPSITCCTSLHKELINLTEIS